MNSTAQAAPSTCDSLMPERSRGRVDERRTNSLAAVQHAVAQRLVQARRMGIARRQSGCQLGLDSSLPAFKPLGEAWVSPGMLTIENQVSSSSVIERPGFEFIAPAAPGLRNRISTFCSACVSAVWQTRVSCTPRSNCFSESSSDSRPARVFRRWLRVQRGRLRNPGRARFGRLVLRAAHVKERWQ